MRNEILIKRYHLKTDKKITNTKIVLISDVHISSIFKKDKLNEIIQIITKEKPNYICIPGDLIDGVNILEEKDNVEVILTFLKKLSAIAKVIISIGNHDISRLLSNTFHTKWKSERNDEFFNQMRTIKNVELLDNDTYEDKNIRFICFTPSFEYYKKNDEDIDILIKEMNDCIFAIDDFKYNVLLCHSPIHLLNDKLLNEVKFTKEVDLFLSGHMHNGMVHPILEKVWKGNRGIITPGKKLFSKRVTRGILKKNDKTLIISGGITKLSYSAPNLFHCFNNFFPMNIEIVNID